MATDLTPEERAALDELLWGSDGDELTVDNLVTLVRAALAAVPRLGREEGERLVPKRQNLRPNVAVWTPAERAIAIAMQAVERAGASPELTDAVILLGYARDKVAEHVLATAPELSAEPKERRWLRDNDVLFDIIELVDIEVPPEVIAGWDDATAKAVHEWAYLTHLSASDNDDVTVPPRPDVLAPFAAPLAAREEENDG